MSWANIIVAGVAGVAAMRAALERGDVDEAARQGALAGPAVVERALGAPDRTTRLAAIAAAPVVEDRPGLLEALARVAAGPDRRTAIPAAGAARAIARELAGHQRPDDIAEDDIATWRRMWADLAMRGDRWIELRILALDTAAALDRGGIGADLGAALLDLDPAFRREAASIVPLPVPAPLRAVLADAVVRDVDPEVALGAAQSLCLSIGHTGGLPLPRDLASPIANAASAQPILDALGAAGVARIRALVASSRSRTGAVRDAARCLAAGGSP